MANVLDYLAKLFGAQQAPADPNAQPDYSAPIGMTPLPGVGPTLPQTGAQDSSQSLPQQSATPTAPLPSVASDDVQPQFRTAQATLPQRIQRTAAADSGPATTLPQTAGLPTIPGPPPYAPVHSWFMNALDKEFLGNSIATHDAQVLGQQLGQYKNTQMQRYAKTLPPELQDAFWADPQGVMGLWEKNKLERSSLKSGETDYNPLLPDDAQYTAPQLDDKSGVFARPIQGGAGVVASPALGGDYKAADGVIASGRTGAVAGTYSLPQKLALSEHIGSFRPGIPGAPTGAGPQLPQMQPLPSTTPTPGDISSILPGSTVSSGYRTPAHNAAVGGVPNSWHTVGSPDAPGALDIVPPAGMPMSVAAATLGQRLPQARVIGEGNHIHVQPNARNVGQGLPQLGQAPAAGPTVDATGSTIDNGPQTGPIWTSPKFNLATNRMEQTNGATGEVRDAGTSPFNPESLRKSVLDHEDYKQATAALTAYKSMIGNAGTMTGPSAYSMLDTFARTINPGAVARSGTIQVIEDNLGLPAQLVGSFKTKFGDGKLPDFARQQILDAVSKFAQAHWDAANALNQSNASVAQRVKLDPRDVVAPLEAMPPPVHAVPPKGMGDLKVGDIYATAKGMAVWNGRGFTPYR